MNISSSPSYIFSDYQKFICPRCEFLLNSTVHIPIVAPCGHTFCDKCVEEEYNEIKKFKCDLCKAESSEHYSQYPTNFYILNIRKNKIKNEYIFIGGKTQKLSNSGSNLLKYGKTSNLNSSIRRSYQNKIIINKYSIKNELTYTFYNNKLEIIKREVKLKKKKI